jgi:hypothetical protein
MIRLHFKMQRYNNNYYYHETIIPIGVKGTYYFDQIFNANSDWDFYMAYNFFRIAAILHGVAQRAANGNASATDAAENGKKSGLLAEIGLTCAGVN